jgi:hypothetical protein
MSSYAEANLLRELQQRVTALQVQVADLAADPVRERVQRLEMRLNGIQGQMALMRNKAAVGPPGAGAADAGAQDKANAAA